jgi:HK97 gp10 family phage protein
VESHKKEVDDALADAIEKALTSCGIRAEELAAKMCPVDTGLLRNSIAFGLDGGQMSKDKYQDDKGKQQGEYGGQLPKAEERTVYIGSNVEYAPYVELGASGRSAQPFLRPAVEGHKSEYREIIQSYLKGKS